MQESKERYNYSKKNIRFHAASLNKEEICHQKNKDDEYNKVKKELEESKSGFVMLSVDMECCVKLLRLIKIFFLYNIFTSQIRMKIFEEIFHLLSINCRHSFLVREIGRPAEQGIKNDHLATGFTDLYHRRHDSKNRHFFKIRSHFIQK